jgi:hypothetical protein
MKTEIITDTIKTDIDWSKPQLVKQIGFNFYLMTTGDHTKDNFTGVCLVQGREIYNFPLTIKSIWWKESFAPITEPITIKFIPE